jgi:predicted dehydrogenase
MPPPLTRRQFAARAALAAGGLLAAPRLLPAAPARTWRVAVIGHTGRGNYGHGLDTMWKTVPGTEVVAVADTDAAGLQAARRRLGNIPGFADYRAMLAEAKPDLVAVAPRHVDQHHAMILAALAAGARGVYVEKPFCRTPREADEILAAARSRQAAVAVAHRNRYHPVLPVVRQLVEAGEIGKLLELRARGKEDTRGGALDLWVLGSHTFNLAAWFAGPPLACSGLLYQDGRPCTAADVRPGDEGVGPIAGNAVHARFEMANGLPLFFDSRRNHGDKDANFGLQLIGTAGVIDFRIDTEPLAHLRRGNPHHPKAPAQPWLPITSGGVDKPEPIPGLAQRIASHQAAGEDLLAALRDARPPLCDAEAGRTTVEMIGAVFASHQLGGARVPLPLTHRDHPLARP